MPICMRVAETGSFAETPRCAQLFKTCQSATEPPAVIRGIGRPD
jgi:hypothetical protein